MPYHIKSYNIKPYHTSQPYHALRHLPFHSQSSFDAAPGTLVVLPFGHFVHFDWRKLGWYVPIGQAKQLAKPLPRWENSPGSHMSL